MSSSRCFNFFRAILLILMLPFFLVLLLLLLVFTIIGSILFALLFSPCLSRLELESIVACVFCFPCVGVYKAGTYVRDNVKDVCSIGCEKLKSWACTVRAMCCYDGASKAELQRKSTAI
jgi:hypothetical protein